MKTRLSPGDRRDFFLFLLIFLNILFLILLVVAYA
jgi:hypothetical protein